MINMKVDDNLYGKSIHSSTPGCSCCWLHKHLSIHVICEKGRIKKEQKQSASLGVVAKDS